MENPRFATESACGGLLDVIVHGLMLVITNGLPGPTSAACSSPVFLVGAESWRVGVGSRFGSPIAQRRPAGRPRRGGRERDNGEPRQDGYALHPVCVTFSHLDLRAGVWPGVRRAGLPKAEPGADAGPRCRVAAPP